MPVVSARPISEQIATKLFDRIHLLAADFTASTSVSEVIRPVRMGGFTPKHLQIVVTQSDPEEVPELFVPGNPPAIAYRQRFNIRCHIMPSEKDPTPFDEYANTMTADVVKAVTHVGATWFTFDGLAIDARWESREFIDADGGVDGINVPLSITYRTSEYDPYAVRV